jgi:SAM-dependent methyltransferase
MGATEVDLNVKNVKAEIRDWWASCPMTYGQLHGQAVYETEDGRTEAIDFGSRAFFQKVDATFYAWTERLHNGCYFGKIFPYKDYVGKNVLEIGCGMGTMAMNWAHHGSRVTAIDLNPVSVAQTTQRFQLYGLNGTIMEMDANALTFPDASFDYVYSWGVLHHSPNLSRSLQEMLRVLRPGGRFGVMLYNRNSVYYRYLIRYVEGFLHGESRFLDPLQLASRYTDAAEQEGNPHTWPVTRREVARMLQPGTTDLRFEALGRIDYALPPKIGAFLPQFLKDAWARRWGWSLWFTGKRAGPYRQAI